MTRSSLFLLLFTLPGLALGGVCSDVGDDAKRLACFGAAAGKCVSIPSDAERLACFDRVYTGAGSPSGQPLDGHRHSLVEAPSGSATKPPPTAEAQAPDGEADTGATVAAGSPGEFGKRRAADAPREYIEATVVDIETSALKIDYLRLDNGQVWREIDDSGLRFRKGRRVTITEGVLNSFDLKMEGYNKIVKVRRIK